METHDEQQECWTCLLRGLKSCGIKQSCLLLDLPSAVSLLLRYEMLSMSGHVEVKILTLISFDQKQCRDFCQIWSDDRQVLVPPVMVLEFPEINTYEVRAHIYQGNLACLWYPR